MQSSKKPKNELYGFYPVKLNGRHLIIVPHIYNNERDLKFHRSVIKERLEKPGSSLEIMELYDRSVNIRSYSITSIPDFDTNESIPLQIKLNNEIDEKNEITFEKPENIDNLYILSCKPFSINSILKLSRLEIHGYSRKPDIDYPTFVEFGDKEKITVFNLSNVTIIDDLAISNVNINAMPKINSPIYNIKCSHVNGLVLNNFTTNKLQIKNCDLKEINNVTIAPQWKGKYNVLYLPLSSNGSIHNCNFLEKISLGQTDSIIEIKNCEKLSIIKAPNCPNLKQINKEEENQKENLNKKEEEEEENLNNCLLF